MTDPGRPLSPVTVAANPLARAIDRAIEFLAAFSLASITILMFLNAAMRYLLDRPIGWTDEAATGAMLWITMLGLMVATRRSELITIRVFVRTLPENVQVVLRVIAELITAVLMLHLAWVGFLYVMTFGGDQTAYLRIPRGVYTMALPLGSVAVTLMVLFQLKSVRLRVKQDMRRDKGEIVGDVL